MRSVGAVGRARTGQKVGVRRPVEHAHWYCRGTARGGDSCHEGAENAAVGSTPVQHERAGTAPVASAAQHPPRTTYGYVPYISIVVHTCAATETRDMRAKNKPFWNFTNSSQEPPLWRKYDPYEAGIPERPQYTRALIGILVEW